MGNFSYIFPGQGSQFVGMGKDICENFKVARLIFEEAQDTLHMDLKRLAFEGPEEELSRTENTQPVILTLSVALFEVLKDTGFLTKNTPSSLAGHSLGEYTALNSADAVSFEDAITIVRKRGEFMHGAVPEGSGAMAAVLGMDEETLIDILSEVSTDDEMVVVANYNCPKQVVISGHKGAVTRASDRAKEEGAFKVVPLKVSVPSHSPLMDKASEKLREVIGGITFSDPIAPVISNVTALPYSGGDAMIDLLPRQLTEPVRWEESVRYQVENGSTDFIEVGPGKVLSGLIKRIDRKLSIFSIGDTDSLKNAEKKYK